MGFKILEEQKVLNFLLPEGKLDQQLKNFEVQKEQQQMLLSVLEALNQSKIALIEAGTGTGKSIAYLIPSILWALINGQRVLISTHTINLQEQLLTTDIPLASKTLNRQVKAVLVKGMSNYICLKKLKEVDHERYSLQDNDLKQLDQIIAWAEKTDDGSLATLSSQPSYHLWESVCAESDTCTRKKCPHFKECHFFKARKEAESAHLLIANHSLLLLDLALKGEDLNKQEDGLLPNYKRVIIDEAHHIEDVATRAFSTHTAYLQLVRLMSKFGGEKRGKLFSLKDMLYQWSIKKRDPEVEKIFLTLEIEISVHRRDILTGITDLFNAFGQFCQKSTEEKKLRILPQHSHDKTWKEVITPLATSLNEQIDTFVQTLYSISKKIDGFNKTYQPLKDQAKPALQEILAYTNRLNDANTHIKEFIKGNQGFDHVLWVESKQLKSTHNTQIVSAPLCVKNQLTEKLFVKFPTVTLCSATMTSSENFKFLKERIGLTLDAVKERAVIEKIYPSPFNYQKQALLLMANDMPDPAGPFFTDAATERIFEIIIASRGSAFVLFTSHQMLEACFSQLKNRFQERKFPLFKQGQANRKTLLEQFKSQKRSVLFGTDSFWEGVDVAGEALKCVIIVKLPFKAPTEPLIAARQEAMKEEGKDAFFNYSLPHAVVKFKQGFGRLIRNKQDRGCIICLDSRLCNKPYGKVFLKSLPDCQKISTAGAEIPELMNQFYKKTHYLTKK